MRALFLLIGPCLKVCLKIRGRLSSIQVYRYMAICF